MLFEFFNVQFIVQLLKVCKLIFENLREIMRIPIFISDELTNDIIESEGLLDLDSGEVTNIKYFNYDVSTEGLPSLKKDYEFTSGILRKDDKELEFALLVKNGSYSVSPDELEELKEKSIKLFTANTTSKKKRI